MHRELVRSAAAMLLLLGAGQAHALGLGQATLGSDLASPLRAHILITRLAGSGIDPDAVVVDVPGFNEHAHLGFPEPVLPADLAVAVVRDADGGARLHLSTQRAVREPVLRFLLRATWPGGSTVREYTLLLDLPQAMQPSRAGAAVRTDARTTPAAAAPQPPASRALHGNPFQPSAPARAGSRYGPVALGDTLYAILDIAYPGRDRAALAQTVVARNPQAFAGGDPGRLLIGATLELPPAAPIARSDAPSAAPTRVATPDTATTTRYVVRPGDTLYAIARAMAGTGRAQIAAVAQHVFERNPQAFVNGDIDRLRAGATLQLDAGPAAATGTPAAAARLGTPEAATRTTASTAAPSGEIEGLQSELARIQGAVGAERERQSALRDRLARTEREIAALRARDAALFTATEALREQLTAATPAPADTGVPHASAAAAAPAAVTPAPARAATPSALVTATAPATEPVPSTPVRAAAAAPAADMQATIPDQTWLAPGLGMIALFALLAVRRRNARTRDARIAQARPRQGDEEASRRRLAAVRDAHASRARTADAGGAPAKTVASADVRHTDSARASALAKEAAMHLAYGDRDAAHTSVVEAIRLAPHQDEHKMMLMTVYQAMGKHERARAIVDELLNRREQLSGEVREQVDQQMLRLVRA